MKYVQYTHAECVKMILDQTTFTPNARKSFEVSMHYNAFAPSTDKRYTAIDADELQKAMADFKTFEIPYVTDEFDCDDYALVLAAILARYCVGVIYVEDQSVGPKHPDRRHALNIAIDTCGKVYMADAGRGLVFDPYEDYHVYFVNLC